MLKSKLFRHLLLLIFFQLCLLMTSCGQPYSFKYKTVPKKLYPSAQQLMPYLSIAPEDKQDIYDLTRSLPKNYVKDGSVDYTIYLQSGLNLNRHVVFPNFPVLVNERGLTLSSNSIVSFQKYSKIIMAANDKENYQVLRIFNVENLKLISPVIEGDRYVHKKQSGEWGMGISIAGSKNIEIINPKIFNCWGDGIYLGKINDVINNEIKIHYAQLDNNRRNGISVVCARNLIINSPLISNTNGTPPMTGIDVEPNYNADEVNNIKIITPVTFNNAENGLSFNPTALEQKSKKVDVEVINHTDFYSRNALNFYFGKQQADQEKTYPPLSSIKIVNPRWYYNFEDRFVTYRKSLKGLKVVISNPAIYKSQKGATIVDKTAIKKFKEHFETQK